MSHILPEVIVSLIGFSIAGLVFFYVRYESEKLDREEAEARRQRGTH